MKFIRVCFFLCITCYATEYSPWLSPPFEFQGRVAYFYNQENFVQSPKGNFKAPSYDSTLYASLGVTPWPNWFVETELFLTRTSEIPFSYQASNLTIRYAWLDDIWGDWISLVTGVTLAFPGNRYLRDFSFTYHGDLNAEVHATIGKEWACRDDWMTRFWLLGGWGIANRGNGWLHSLAFWECKPISCIALGLYSEGIFGLGNNDIIPDEPFEGFASIQHQNVDLGCYLDYSIPYVGTLKVIGWYNVYARNFVENYWGAGISMLLPFSVL